MHTFVIVPKLNQNDHKHDLYTEATDLYIDVGAAGFAIQRHAKATDKGIAST